MRPQVDIILINWNCGEQTMAAVAPYLNCQSSILDCRIIVVDNASTDKSSDLFAGRIGHIIYNQANLGFGKACNQAFAQSNADYILLLKSRYDLGSLRTGNFGSIPGKPSKLCRSGPTTTR